MGNEPSTLVDEKTHPSVLEARTVDALAKYVHEKRVRKIVVMVRLPGGQRQSLRLAKEK